MAHTPFGLLVTFCFFARNVFNVLLVMRSVNVYAGQYYNSVPCCRVSFIMVYENVEVFVFSTFPRERQTDIQRLAEKREAHVGSNDQPVLLCVCCVYGITLKKKLLNIVLRVHWGHLLSDSFFFVCVPFYCMVTMCSLLLEHFF